MVWDVFHSPLVGAVMLITPSSSALTIFGSHQANALAQIHAVSQYAVRTALMADGQVAKVMPVGGVAAFRDQVSVSGVSADIGCGIAAIRTSLCLTDITRGLTLEEFHANPYRFRSDPIANEIAQTLSNTLAFGIGRKNEADDAPTDHPIFLDPAWYIIPNIGGFRDTLREKAQRQLGTLGNGNHFCDVLVDRQGRVWVMAHFGSRSLGATLNKNFMAIGQGGTWGDTSRDVETLLETSQGAGYDYWQAMTMAGQYALAGRTWVVEKVASLLGASVEEVVNSHHNFAWKEQVSGEELIVVRKGATPAFPGQRGAVGGSMGDDAVIVEGVEAAPGSEMFARQEAALFSTVHGAGRVMSRTAAGGKRNWKTGKVLAPGKISGADLEAWLNRRGVILKGGGLQEAPQAYRRLSDVLEAQDGTVRVIETLRPLIVVMAAD
jgi:tRNA-splicing ligase RtcB